MKIIVDANIVFSGILNTNGKIADLLINSHKHFDFIAPNFLRTEIKKHHVRLAKISKLSLEQVKEAEKQICNEITFIEENKLKESVWRNAQKLTDDVDPKDVVYVSPNRFLQFVFFYKGDFIANLFLCLFNLF